jgi:hypothetical protein
VTGITFFVVDNSAAEAILLSTSRYNPANAETTNISSTTTSVNSPSIQQVSLTGGFPFTIDNSTYAYRLRVEFGATGEAHTLYGVRVTYNLSSVPPAGDDTISMAGADFRSSSSIMTYAAIGGTLYATAIDSSYYFATRLDLPDGAIIKEIDWYVIDNHADSFNLQLYSHNPAIDSFTIPISVDTGDLPLSTSVQVVSRVVSIVVDNDTKSYSIGFMPLAASANLRIVGARVRYTPPPARQAVQVKTFSGVHFSPSGSSLTYRVQGIKLYALALSSGRSFQVSLNLPDGVRIEKIVIYVKDNSSEDIGLVGRFYTPANGGYSDPLTGSSSGASSAIQSVTFFHISSTMGIMDTSQSIARLRATPGASGTELLLVGARVEYFYPNVYLPAVIK